MIRVTNIKRCVASVALTLLLGSCFKSVGAIEVSGGLGGETPGNDPYNNAGSLAKMPRRLGAISTLLTDGTAYSFNFADVGGLSNVQSIPDIIPAGSVSPFTFTTTEPLILQVADTEDPDVNTFNVTDNGVLLGCSTSAVHAANTCSVSLGCFASQGHASFTFVLPAGSHALAFPRPAGHPSKPGIFRLVPPVCGTVLPPTYMYEHHVSNSVAIANVAIDSNQPQAQSLASSSVEDAVNFNNVTRGRSLEEEAPLQQTARAGNLRSAAHRALNGWFPCGTNTFCVKERSTCAIDANDIGTCTCNDGYDGVECDPVDECEIDFPCPGGSICVDMFPPMMFKCECKEGFTPFLPNALPDAPGVPPEYRPVSCIDYDECADTDNPPCHSMASCTNTVGNFECKCNEGLVGNGITTCAEPAQVETVTEAPPQFECSVNTDCQGTNMQCVDNECSCRPGYVQVGPNCQNEVHCDEVGFNNDCHRRATCAEEDGFPGFSCTCIEGWEDAFEGANGKSCKDIPPVTEAPPPVTDSPLPSGVQSGVGPHPNRPTVFPKCLDAGAQCDLAAASACCTGICGVNLVVSAP